MRTFWILILLLAAGAAGWLAIAPDTGVTPAPAQPKPDAIHPASARETGEPAEEGEDPDRSAALAVPAARAPEPLTQQEIPAGPEQSEAPAAPAEPVEPAAAPEDARTAEATQNDAPGVEPRDEPAAPEAAAPAGAAATNEAAESEAGALKPVQIVEQEDGSLLVDGRYVVKGKGTPDEPYQVTWDLLVSAGEVYQPRQGRTELPGRIKMLAGKHVQITGNIAFPLMAEEAGELLAMLNQWDGCCIGVPPTPYDAIEVQLREPVTGPDRLATFGSVTGRLDVQPHLVGNWLVGLYVMEDATLATKAFGGFSP